MSINVVVVSGNLGANPELRYTPSGKAVTEFSVAVNEGTGDHKTTIWLRCTAWDKLAEVVAELARKGSTVVVDGRLTQDTWTDRDGKQQSKLKVTARNVQVVSGRAKPKQSVTEADLSDLPF